MLSAEGELRYKEHLADSVDGSPTISQWGYSYFLGKDSGGRCAQGLLRSAARRHFARSFGVVAVRTERTSQQLPEITECRIPGGAAVRRAAPPSGKYKEPEHEKNNNSRDVRGALHPDTRMRSTISKRYSTTSTTRTTRPPANPTSPSRRSRSAATTSGFRARARATTCGPTAARCWRSRSSKTNGTSSASKKPTERSRPSCRRSSGSRRRQIRMVVRRPRLAGRRQRRSAGHRLQPRSFRAHRQALLLDLAHARRNEATAGTSWAITASPPAPW